MIEFGTERETSKLQVIAPSTGCVPLPVQLAGWRLVEPGPVPTGRNVAGPTVWNVVCGMFGATIVAVQGEPLAIWQVTGPPTGQPGQSAIADEYADVIIVAATPIERRFLMFMSGPDKLLGTVQWARGGVGGGLSTP
jgi:hypothetical protein